jgi:ABC-2 type transport system permease protein
MRAQVRSEFLKQWSTRTALGLFAAMLGLVLFAVLLHAFRFDRTDIGRTGSEQLTRVFGPGTKIGVLCAGLFGALSITTECRYGTIRPTFLVTPRRERVVTAKLVRSMLFGVGFGVAACGLAAGAATIALRVRVIDVRLDGGDYALRIAGGRGGSRPVGGCGARRDRPEPGADAHRDLRVAALRRDGAVALSGWDGWMTAVCGCPIRWFGRVR